MVRIALVTGGSRGDFQPYLALGAELRRRGYEVVVVTYAPYKRAVEDLGLSFVGVSGDPMKIVEVLTEAGGDFVRFARRFRRALEPSIEQNFEETLEGCRGADAVVYASVAFLGFVAARELAVPSIMAEMQPLFEPTGRFPSAVVPEGPRWLRRPYNRLSYAVVRQIYWQTFRPMLEKIEEGRTDLERLPRLRSPWGSLKRSGSPVLCGWSPRVLPRPASWDERLRVTGYWFLDRATSWSPPSGLERFLRDGAPTVAIGFSSVRAGANVRNALDRVLRAADANGMRSVFVGGWSGITGQALPSSAFAVEDAPHDWLFPRVSAVVHHGGAGTTAAALRAGVPSVVLPFSADQAFWGRAVERVGAGVLGTGKGGDVPADLERALALVLEERLRAGAAAIGDELRRERGAAVACDVIERTVIERSAER